MKVNLVTGKPADGGPARCLLLSESADPVIDLYDRIFAAGRVLRHPDGTEERFAQIALFLRPATKRRSGRES